MPIRRCPMRWTWRRSRTPTSHPTGRLIGPLHGVVLAIKDQYDTFDMRTTVGHGCRLRERSSAARRHLRQAPAGRGCDHHRQGESRRNGDAELAQLLRRALLQSLRHGTQSRHLQRRLRIIGCRKPGDVLHRRGNRRIHPSPRQEQQHRGTRADAGAGQSRRHDRRGVEYARGTAVPHGQGCRPRARGHRRLRSQG